MPPANSKPPAQRKRTRKRKRRAVSSSSSGSSSSDSESSDDESQSSTAKLNTAKAAAVPPKKSAPSSSESSSESSSSSSDEEETPAPAVQPRRTSKEPIRRPVSRSPSPLETSLPSFLPEEGAAKDAGSTEQDLKDRFRQFWMASIVDGFKDDLEQIRKEPNLGASRLALLVDSLASGAEVFTASSAQSGQTDEMEMLLG